MNGDHVTENVTVDLSVTQPEPMAVVSQREGGRKDQILPGPLPYPLLSIVPSRGPLPRNFPRADARDKQIGG
jgi:hypothetical protein